MSDPSEFRRLLEAFETGDRVDTVQLDVPLLLRMLEFSREDAQQDVDLHVITDRMIELGLDGRTLNMDDYAAITSGVGSDTGEDY